MAIELSGLESVRRQQCVVGNSIVQKGQYNLLVESVLAGWSSDLTLVARRLAVSVLTDNISVDVKD